MLQKEPKKLKSHKPFTGFIAYYDNGKIIKEHEDFFSKKLNKKCATNWAEIDKNKLIKLELIWQDTPKGYITKSPSEQSFNKTYTLNPQDWFFSQKGYFDLNTRQIIVIARNIGYIESGIVNILSAIEQTGIVQIYSRKS